MRLVIDTGVLGRICNPALFETLCREMEAIASADLDTVFILPEVVDYEERRKLEHLARSKDAQKKSYAQESLRRLNLVRETLTPAEVTNQVVREAAKLWALARIKGRPTAPDKSVDFDVIIASHCRLEKAQVLTFNRKDLTRYGVKVSPLSSRFG